MRYLFLLLLTGCLTLPNKPECFRDTATGGRCSYPVSGNDFIVDNSGNNNYTLDGHNWTWDELTLNSLVTPPETYAADKAFFLQWCHENPNSCNYQDASDAFADFEDDSLILLNIEVP